MPWSRVAFAGDQRLDHGPPGDPEDVGGDAKALVAVARSMLVIIWHLIDDPNAHYSDLGADHHQRWTDPARKARDLIRQLEALGHHVTLTTPAPSTS